MRSLILQILIQERRWQWASCCKCSKIMPSQTLFTRKLRKKAYSYPKSTADQSLAKRSSKKTKMQVTECSKFPIHPLIQKTPKNSNKNWISKFFKARTSLKTTRNLFPSKSASIKTTFRVKLTITEGNSKTSMPKWTRVSWISSFRTQGWSLTTS